MAITLFLKLLFAVALNLVVLPFFSRNRRVGTLILYVFVLLAFFIALELQVFSNRLTHVQHGGHLSSVFWMNLIVYFAILSVSFVVFFTREWYVQEKQRRELVEYKLTSELNVLKSQINPHFLFNTLNNLFSLAQKHNNPELAEGLHKLSGMMRYVLYDSSTDKVSLADELAYIRDYIGLSKLRYADSEVRAHVSVTGDPEKCYIAPMLLIPFVENAFKHGVRPEKDSFVGIIVDCSGGRLVFLCTNRVFDSKPADSPRGIGLNNVRGRLDLLYKGDYKLDITEDGEYYGVRLELPIYELYHH